MFSELNFDWESYRVASRIIEVFHFLVGGFKVYTFLKTN